jgi:hypothetical protein
LPKLKIKQTAGGSMDAAACVPRGKSRKRRIKKENFK